jgi:hypothetical protein
MKDEHFQELLTSVHQSLTVIKKTAFFLMIAKPVIRSLPSFDGLQFTF